MGSGNSGGYVGNAGPAPGYILNRDVVLVTLNYRLGAFSNKCNSEERVILFLIACIMFVTDVYVTCIKVRRYMLQTGFLSTEDTEAPGNYGLLDQSLGLKYVKKRINRY